MEKKGEGRGGRGEGREKRRRVGCVGGVRELEGSGTFSYETFYLKKGYLKTYWSISLKKKGQEKETHGSSVLCGIVYLLLISESPPPG